MNLEDFVFESITQIANGIERAQKSSGGKYLVSPKHRETSLIGNKALIQDSALETIDFDIAITAETKGSGGGGISVVGVRIGGEHESSSLNVSRVKFQIMVQWPRQKV